ncbi:hypothetical protein AVEN_76278-1 [Araneus ventricosus]|uniref:Uncharacterized protein n=1 Tax=Araneus ventricosus TaxID=182803 RepID=A0A4Y2TAA7_ARAVE|nr:hypothetical protein AVEN_76278-1 [Araneus ventricosus]
MCIIVPIAAKALSQVSPPVQEERGDSYALSKVVHGTCSTFTFTPAPGILFYLQMLQYCFPMTAQHSTQVSPCLVREEEILLFSKVGSRQPAALLHY